MHSCSMKPEIVEGQTYLVFQANVFFRSLWNKATRSFTAALLYLLFRPVLCTREEEGGTGDRQNSGCHPPFCCARLFALFRLQNMNCHVSTFFPVSPSSRILEISASRLLFARLRYSSYPLFSRVSVHLSPSTLLKVRICVPFSNLPYCRSTRSCT